MPDHVDTKAVDPLAQPEAKYLAHCFDDVGIAPVQVGLRVQEGVVVILPRRGIELPGAAAEFRQPVAGWPAIGGRIAPDVPVTLRIILRPAAFDKPCMLVRRVVRDEIEDHLDPARMRLRNQPLEIRQRAEDRIDVGIVGDVVAEILHRRTEYRRNPDRIDTEIHQVRHPLRDPVEVADPVAIAVLKRPRIDLIDDCGFPPRPRPIHSVNRSDARSPERLTRTIRAADDSSEEWSHWPRNFGA
jgi:hypothetical protein